MVESTTRPSTTTAPGRSWHGYPIVLPNRHDPRLRLAAVTTSLHVLGQITFDFNLSIAQILVSLLAAGLVEFLISLLRDHRIAWPASALLTGNSVALILRVPGTEHGDWWSMRGWYIFAATSALAVASKYVIRWKGAHFFNPSNLMLVVVFLALGESRVDPQILWWGPWSLGLAAGFAVILGGSIAVTHHVRQLHTALAFWAPFAALMVVLALSGHAITTNWHVGPLAGWPYWVTLVLSPEVMVFAFFMITDPKASPVTDRGKVIFGFTIALLSATFVATQSGEFGTKVGILAGLVVLCPAIPYINARTGAPAKPVPTGVPFVPSPDGAPLVIRAATSDEASDSTPANASADASTATPSNTDTRDVSPAALFRSFTPRHAAAAVVALAIAGLVVYIVGSHWTFTGTGNTDASTNVAALERRGEVTLEGIELPAVELDDTAARSAFRLTQQVAEQVADDTVVDLLLEASAVSHRDSELAAAGIAGARLRTIGEAIDRLNEDPTIAPPAEVAYTIDSLTVTLFRPDDGPQTPPELAVAVTGIASGQSGSRDIDTWFTVTQVGDHYLITGAFDPDRKPVTPAPIDPTISGGAGLDPDSDAAIAETTTPATPDELAGLTLVDRASEMGLTLPHSLYGLGEGQDFRIGGAAVGDFDGDGFPDIFLTRVGYPNVLYRNDDGSGFVDVTKDAGLSTVPSDEPIDGGSSAAAFVDLDGDGNLDLIVLGMPGTSDQVFLGDGLGHFTDGSDRWDLTTPDEPPGNSLAVDLAVSDIDGDGRPDVLVVASEPDRITAAVASVGLDDPETDVCSSDAQQAIDALESAPSGTRLLLNTGSGFEDATNRLGIDPSRIAANSAAFVDLDHDGDDDLIITGGSCTTKVLINDGGTFTDRTAEVGFDQIPQATGITTLDANDDGLRDVFLAGISYPSSSGRCQVGVPGFVCSTNRLMLNDGDGRFTDAAERYQVQYSGWAWGAAASDLNNDGFDDLYVSNGTRSVQQWWNDVDPDAGAPYDWSTSTDRLWLGASEGAMRSTEAVGDEPIVTRPSDVTRGRAVIAADFDRDGRMDLLVIDTSSRPSLLMNTTNNANHWIGIELVDPPTPVGATVVVDLGDGTTITRRVDVGGSYQSGTTTAVHVGLGSVTTVDNVTVTWSDGHSQAVETPPVDRWARVGGEGLR